MLLFIFRGNEQKVRAKNTTQVNGIVPNNVPATPDESPKSIRKQPLLLSLFGILVYALQVVFLRALPKPSQALLADFYTGLLIVVDPGLLADISGLAGFSALNATRRSPHYMTKTTIATRYSRADCR